MKLYIVRCFDISGIRKHKSLSCWWECIPLYFMRLSSVYHMRTSSAFLFKPRAAIPSARLPPVNLSSAERIHLINTLFKKHMHLCMGVVLHNRLHATTEKLQYRCSNRVRPFPLQCWSSPWRRQDLGRGNNIILKGKELITGVVRLIFWTPKRHVILHPRRLFSPLLFRTYLWGQSCWYLSGSKPFGERTETPGIWISSWIIEHVMNATISK